MRWLGEETLRRYYKSKGGAGHFESEKVYEVRKAKGGAILDIDDAIKDVLDDDDFVTVGNDGVFMLQIFQNTSFIQRSINCILVTS